MRTLLFTLLFIGVLVYVASLSYNKVVSLALARSSINYFQNSPNDKESEVIVIGNCEGKFSFNPRNILIPASGEVHIINSDSTPHTIGFAYTRFWESIPPGGSLVVDMDYLKESNKVLMTCDGLLLEDPPTIARQDLK
jgi:hypothetical protein